MTKFEVRFFAFLFFIIPTILIAGWVDADSRDRVGVTTVQHLGAR